jgi:hypothetical protein
MEKYIKELLVLLTEDLSKDFLNELEVNSEDIDDSEKMSATNISFVGSPSYPRIFWGESTKPLTGQYPNSEYVDDNIHRSYQGLLSYFG